MGSKACKVCKETQWAVHCCMRGTPRRRSASKLYRVYLRNCAAKPCKAHEKTVFMEARWCERATTLAWVQVWVLRPLREWRLGVTHTHR